MSVLPVGIGSAEAGGFQIERSLRFNSADSAYLSKAFTTNSDVTQATLSFWHKRSILATEQQFYAARDSTANENNRFFVANFQDNIYIRGYDSSANLDLNLITSAVYRDTSSWYSIIIVLDTTQATSSDRVKLYVNGERVTVFGSSTYPSLNQTFRLANSVNNSIGHTPGGSAYLNGYLAEYHFIDGSALDPTSFGEYNTDTGVWQPKAYTGSYGTNGFYLNFSDNSGTTSTTLGKDSSGNGNNWTPNNFSVTAGAGNDSLVDTPTPYGTDTGAGGEVRGNYCTLNPLRNGGLTLSNGNLDFGGTTNNIQVAGTIAFPTSGKWYFEVVPTAVFNYWGVGIMNTTVTVTSGALATEGFEGYSADGTKFSGAGSFVSYGNAFVANDVIGVAVDMDNGAIYFSKNNTWQNSGVPTSGASKTGAAFTDLLSTGYTWTPAFFSFGNGNTGVFNFGQRPFAYPLSGFKALCTQNLPESTIVDGGQYFNTVLWAGNGSTQSITGYGFAPDFAWIKSRTDGQGHVLYDQVRPLGNYLTSNATDAEQSLYSMFTAWGSDGFSLTTTGGNNTNGSGRNYVGWAWKANGSGVSNTAGTITSTVSANTDSGFSIVTWSGTSSAGTVGHGLGVAPSMIIAKVRNTANDWPMYHVSLGNTKILRLNTTDAELVRSRWNNTTPTSSVFSVDNNNEINGSGYNYVAYCFAAIPGYSAFGSYTGNGSADGPMIFTGFKPAFVLFKNASTGTNWWLQDTARNTYNVCNLGLRPNTSDAEQTEATLDMLSNGFKVRVNNTTINGSGNTIIYAAFAENPFKYSLAR